MGVDERYAQWSVGLLVGYLVILVLLAHDAMPRTAVEAPVPVLEEPPAPAEAAGASG